MDGPWLPDLGRFGSIRLKIQRLMVAGGPRARWRSAPDLGAKRGPAVSGRHFPRVDRGGVVGHIGAGKADARLGPMKILVATDAWQPQRNGVVRALQQTSAAAARLGVTFEFLTPQEFATVPMPGYPEIPLSLAMPSTIAQRIKDSGADHIHIATEGPLGFLARGACLETGRRFTTSYLTKFPEYIAARMPVPPTLSYAVLRWFHNAGAGVMVVTASIERDLREAWLPQRDAVDQGRRRRAVPAARQRRSWPQAAGVPLCRARGGGEERRGVPGARPARHQGGGGRWPLARGAGAQLSGRGVRRRQGRRGSGDALRQPPTCWCSPAAPTCSAT